MAESRSVLTSAARTSTSTSGAIASVPNATQVGITVNVSAVSGTTPSMTLSVEWSNDGGTTWHVGDPADQFTAITAAAAVAKAFSVKGAAYRLKWTITGTSPSFTFSARDYSVW